MDKSPEVLRTDLGMYRLILLLAIPNIVSNISVPLLSLADTAIAGRMEHAGTIGAVAMASMVANFTYWLWGFLRMTTTGFTAQAYGRGDRKAMMRQFAVGTSLALAGSVLILLLRPVLYLFLGIVAGEESASLIPEAERYLRVAYLGAPAALLLYVYNGWFVGMQNTLLPMYTTILSNVLNIGLSVALVRYADMGVEGIAWGTVVSQYVAIAILLGYALVRYRAVFSLWRWQDCYAIGVVFTYIHIAKYLLLRTLMLGSISLYFVHAGGSYDPLILSANALLMQLFTIFAYFMDGFAYAGEALTGRFIGARAGDALGRLIRTLLCVGAVLAPLVSLVYFVGADELLALLSDKAEVLAVAERYVLWSVAIPLASFLAFLWDGVFVGATNSRMMMLAVSLAWASFFVSYFACRAWLGEHALWLAFVLYLAVRSALSTLWGLRLVSRLTTTELS